VKRNSRYLWSLIKGKFEEPLSGIQAITRSLIAIWVNFSFVPLMSTSNFLTSRTLPALPFLCVAEAFEKIMNSIKKVESRTRRLRFPSVPYWSSSLWSSSHPFRSHEPSLWLCHSPRREQRRLSWYYNQTEMVNRALRGDIDRLNLVSAMLVASTILRTPSGGVSKTCFCCWAGIDECSAMTTKCRESENSLLTCNLSNILHRG